MKRKLGELLIEAGAVTSEDVENALADQSAGEPSRLGDLLLSTGKITPAALAKALAVQHALPFADLSYVAPEASALIPLEFQRAHRIVPFRLDRDGGATRVHVALADPTLIDVVDELRSQLKREVIVHVAPIDDIENVHSALAGEGAGEPVVMGEVLEEEEVFMTPELAPEPEVTAEAALPYPPPLDLFSPPPAVDQPGEEFVFPEPPPPAASSGPTADELFGQQLASDSFSFEDGPVEEVALEVDVTRPNEVFFPQPPSAVAFDEPAPPPIPSPAPSGPPASVTEEELFGSLDLGGPAEVAPLSTDLADEIGRHDVAPPAQDYSGFSALAAPLGDPTGDRFGARSSPPAPIPPEPVEIVPEAPLTAAPVLEPEVEAPLLDAEILDVPKIVAAPLVPPEPPQKLLGAEPPRIPSFAIPPDVPVEPRRSPVEPLRRPATLGRIALKRVAVNREGVAVSVPAAPPAVIVPPPPAPAPAPEPRNADLELPEWMRSTSDAPPVIPLLPAADPGAVSAKLVALLARVESGDLPNGPVLASLLRLLVERRVLDDAAVAVALEKL